MKQLHSLLSILALFLILEPVLAAIPPGGPNNGIITPLLYEDPPPDEQGKVYGTDVTVIFKDYLPVRRVGEVRYLRLVQNVQYDIIKSLSIARAGDHRVHAPNLGPWRYGPLYITAHNPQLEMTWEILAHALRGMLDFYDNWGTMLMRALIVDKNLGFVGEVKVGQGYFKGENVTASGDNNVVETA